MRGSLVGIPGSAQSAKRRFGASSIQKERIFLLPSSSLGLHFSMLRCQGPEDMSHLRGKIFRFILATCWVIWDIKTTSPCVAKIKFSGMPERLRLLLTIRELIWGPKWGPHSNRDLHLASRRTLSLALPPGPLLICNDTFLPLWNGCRKGKGETSWTVDKGPAGTHAAGMVVDEIGESKFEQFLSPQIETSKHWLASRGCFIWFLILALIRGNMCPWSGWSPASPLVDPEELGIATVCSTPNHEIGKCRSKYLLNYYTFTSLSGLYVAERIFTKHLLITYIYIYIYFSYMPCNFMLWGLSSLGTLGGPIIFCQKV